MGRGSREKERKTVEKRKEERESKQERGEKKKRESKRGERKGENIQMDWKNWTRSLGKKQWKTDVR